MSPFIPFSQDPLAAAAGRLLDHYSDTLPDLSRAHVLVADTQCAPALRAALLEQAAARGCNALLGPTIERLDSWLAGRVGLEQRVLSRPAQELILGEALRGARALYADTDPWLLADKLLELFEDMTRHQFPMPGELAAFNRLLADSYGLPEPSAALQQEAYILHTLWHAWHEQLDAENATDPAGAHIARLEADLALPADGDLWLLGFTEFSPAESRWLATLMARGQARLLLHGRAEHDGTHPDAPLRAVARALALDDNDSGDEAADVYSAFFESLFDVQGGNLKQRAIDFATAHSDDPLSGRLQTLCCDDPEHEAQAVALQVRRWLLADLRPLAIVTEDRRLARRVRAMLEASAVTLDDPAGWALSTTSAAAVIERWLETVEEDFACGPLLDVLKSPFVSHDRGDHLALVRRLEQDIILHENIARGLARYRRHLDLRRERLPEWSDQHHRDLHALLNSIDHAAAPLLPLLQGSHGADSALQALVQSLRELGAWEALQADAAGQAVIETLEQLGAAASAFATGLTWQELRNWLGRSLERATFRPPGNASAVRLLTLEQTRLQRFAGIVVAGCSRAHLPGTPGGQAFFNQRVRIQLGLPGWEHRLTGRLHHFVRVLHSAGQLLLTRHSEADGEPVPASPWWELLEAFHANAYGDTLQARELHALLGLREARPRSSDTRELPQAATRPAPSVPAARLPSSWSAATHQRLIDCPYRFFAADTLGLKPQEEIREALSKNEYGALIHRILQAFHSDVPNLPGPWQGALREPDRTAAIALLERITARVFDKAIEEDFQVRGWLRQWLDCLPAYIDWQIVHRQHWQTARVEFKAERDIDKTLKLKGRIDRIDQRDGAHGIIDYKTGQAPGTEDVLAGEAVQLPSYALMLDTDVEQLDYLAIRSAEVRATTVVAGEDTASLVRAVGARLADLHQALQCQARLPAWGDARTCGYCEFSGLCRREVWSNAEGGDA